jgi:iron-sulfur cluster repair protein YtfE (RIC family)
MQDIDPDVTIEELVARYPRAAAILRRFGIVCIQCGEPVWGTLRELAAARGVTDLEVLLAALAADDARETRKPRNI